MALIILKIASFVIGFIILSNIVSPQPRKKDFKNKGEGLL